MIIKNIAQLVCPSSLLTDAAIVLDGNRVAWLGPTCAVPPSPTNAEVIDATGKVALPGLIDSHTHLIFAGSREDEFQQRTQGKSYQDVPAHGGGINATVRRVRQASEEELKALARPRLQRMLRLGVTTVY